MELTDLIFLAGMPITYIILFTYVKPREGDLYMIIFLLSIFWPAPLILGIVYLIAFSLGTGINLILDFINDKLA